MTNFKISTPDLPFKDSLFINNKYRDYHITAQKNIVKDLTDNFPDIEFTFTEQDALIIVEWTDAATCEEVSKIIGKYNLLDYKGDSDTLTLKADTSFNKIYGACFLVLYHWVTSETITGHKTTHLQIMKGTRSPELINGNDALTAAENIKIELKHYYPNYKFEIIANVAKDNYGSTIDIIPETKDIDIAEIKKKITDKYEVGEYITNEFNHSIYTLKKDLSFNDMHGGTGRVFIIPPFESKPHRIV